MIFDDVLDALEENSPLAIKTREYIKFIESMREEGKTEEEIKAFFISKKGEGKGNVKSEEEYTEGEDRKGKAEIDLDFVDDLAFFEERKGKIKIVDEWGLFQYISVESNDDSSDDDIDNEREDGEKKSKKASDKKDKPTVPSSVKTLQSAWCFLALTLFFMI